MGLQYIVDMAKMLRENMIKGNREQTAKNLQELANMFSKELSSENNISTENLKCFNGLMKYILVSFENGDFYFGSEVIRNNLIPLLTDMQIKQVREENTPDEGLDSITKAIQSQYTDFMYPNIWRGVIPEGVKNGSLTASPLCNPQYIQHIASKKMIPNNKLEVLIAGCGTGEVALISALTQPSVSFTFVDISLASLRMTKQYAEELGVKNVEILQADIMTMDLGKEFDIIISTGVIHHLSNPSEGVANLKRHLKERGVLSAMVYGEYGRFEIGLFQDALKIMLNGDVDFNSGIEIVKVLMRELDGSNRIANIAWKQDLNRGEQHIVDLLLNVNENRYNIKSLNKMINDGGMKVIDFINRGILNPNNYYKSEQMKELCNKLGFMDKCHLAELMNGKLTQHQFFAIKQENDFRRLSIDDDNFMNYYIYKSPVLIETTIIESERKRHFVKLSHVKLLDIANAEEYNDLLIEGNHIKFMEMCNGSMKISEIVKELKGKLSINEIRKFVKLAEGRNILFMHE